MPLSQRQCISLRSSRPDVSPVVAVAHPRHSSLSGGSASQAVPGVPKHQTVSTPPATPARAAYPATPMSYPLGPLMSTRGSAPSTHSHRRSSQSSSSQSSRLQSLQITPADAEYFATWRNRKLRTPGPVPWPCDSQELERIEAQHWLLRLMLGYPYIGPMEHVVKQAGAEAKILDLASGVGVWATDIGGMFPWAKVTGADNVPVQASESWANVEWDIVDLENLPYDPESFDVVHVRFAKLRVRSYSGLLRSAWRIVKPGGVLLIFDAAGPPQLSTGESTVGARAWTHAFHRSLRMASLGPFSVDEVIRVFRNMELVGSDMRVPIGHGQGRMGQLGNIHVVNTKAYLEAARYVMIEHGGYTDAEVDVLTAAYLQDVKEHPLYTRYHAFSVRKPA